MRKVDETAEQAAGLRRRRKIIAAIALAVLVHQFLWLVAQNATGGKCDSAPAKRSG